MRASPFPVDVIRWYKFAILIEVPFWFELPWFIPVLLTVVELPQIEEDLQQIYTSFMNIASLGSMKETMSLGGSCLLYWRNTLGSNW